MKNGRMSNGERVEISHKYKTAIDRGDYEEAGELNNGLYESEFNRYLKLMQGQREYIAAGGKIEINNLAIKEVLSGLRNLLEVRLKLIDIQHKQDNRSLK